MMQLDLLSAPTARRFDPQTSRDAAESARELAARHHRIILDALSRGPAGDSGMPMCVIAKRCDLSPQAVTDIGSGRTSEPKDQARSDALDYNGIRLVCR